MLNTITIMGRLVRDPELRYTASQTEVTSFTIACDRDFTNSNNERETDFIDCVAWKGTASFICNNFHKGEMICVDGRLQIREWADKENNKRKSAEVVVEKAYFAASKRTEAISKEPEFIDDEGELPFL